MAEPDGTGGAGAQLATVSIGSTPGAAIPPTFMGLAHEWGDALLMMGDSEFNPIYRQCVSNLTAYGSGPMILRIGGNSADKTREPTDTTAAPFAAVAKATGAHFIISVNLGAGDVDLAVRQAKAYASQMPPGSLDAIEIGNEPDDYFKNGMRPPNYSDQDYLADFEKWKEAIMPVLPAGLKLQAPAWAFSHKPEVIESFLAREAGVLASFSQHIYGTNPEAHPPDDFLLTEKAALKGPLAVAAEVAAAHAHGVPFRMGEGNSISHGGMPGISDAFGSALWVIDNMFEYLKVGVDGVNWISTSKNAYSLIYYAAHTSNGKKTYALSSIHPIYYGLLFFQEATGNQARLLPVTLSTKAHLKAWATVDASGTRRLVLINKDEAQAGAVAVTMQGSSRASVLRLMAASYKSTSGVNFAGQTFDGSTDGKIQGTRTPETIAGRDGVFQVPMPITSAAIVVFSK